MNRADLVEQIVQEVLKTYNLYPLCKCGKLAIWRRYVKTELYYCDDHLPRKRSDIIELVRSNFTRLLNQFLALEKPRSPRTKPSITVWDHLKLGTVDELMVEPVVEVSRECDGRDTSRRRRVRRKGPG